MTTKLFRKRRYKISKILFWSLLISLLAGACASKEKMLVKDGLTLVYRDKDKGGRDISKMSLNHPVDLTEDNVRRHLVLLTYEDMALMGNKKFVFTKNDIDILSPLLTKAFTHAPANSFIHFDFESENGTTKVDTFASQEKIHWRISMINNKKFSNSPQTNWRDGFTWRLLPRQGQRFFYTENLIGKKTNYNWILANLNPPKAYRKSAKDKKTSPTRLTREPVNNQAVKHSKRNTSKRGSSQSKSDPTLEEKLQLLKNLHNKGLINDNEYEHKRKELVDNFF